MESPEMKLSEEKPELNTTNLEGLDHPKLDLPLAFSLSSDSTGANSSTLDQTGAEGFFGMILGEMQLDPFFGNELSLN